MSALQCPATLVLTCPGEPHEAAERLVERLAALRVSYVWHSDQPDAVRTAEILAARCGVGLASRHDLRERTDGEPDVDVVERIRTSLAEIADLHPGESVLVITHPGALRLVVPRVCRMDVPPQDITPGGSIEIEIDAEDWVCRRWEAAR